MNSEQPVKRYRGQRGPNKVKKPTMAHVTLRMPQDVADWFRQFSEPTVEMRKVLLAHVEAQTDT
jgi:hypothetical protein